MAVKSFKERFDTLSPTSCCPAGANPTTLLLDVRVINIRLVINWSNMMHWRHVVLTGLRDTGMLRLSAISHLLCGPTMQAITQRVNGCRKFSSLAGPYAENVLRYVRPWVVHRARGSLAGYCGFHSLLVPERGGSTRPVELPAWTVVLRGSPCPPCWLPRQDRV
jgi:hypothetical protein